jgi:hypothetical protein
MRGQPIAFRGLQRNHAVSSQIYIYVPWSATFFLLILPDLHIPVLFHESSRIFFPALISSILDCAIPSSLIGKIS